MGRVRLPVLFSARHFLAVAKANRCGHGRQLIACDLSNLTCDAGHDVNPSSCKQTDRVNILGTGITPLTMQEAVDRIEQAILDRAHNYVCVAAAHSVMDCRRQPDLRRVFNQSMMTTPDGMPLVWLARLKTRQPVERVYGPDLMLAICQSSLGLGFRHFFYGGEPGVADRLASRLRDRFSGLQVAGAYSPPFRPLRPEEDAEIVRQIGQARADLVWVGLGTGKQERWMADHLGKIAAPMMVGVGTAFDLLSGRKSQAPRWMQRSGLEWLYRLTSEPGRLWRRYIEYPWFIALVVAQLAGFKEFQLED